MLAIFKEMNADHTLNACVFGESIFNDAIAIVMFNAVIKPGNLSADQIGASISRTMKDFAMIFMASVALGMITALVCAFTLKRQTAKLEGEN